MSGTHELISRYPSRRWAEKVAAQLGEGYHVLRSPDPKHPKAPWAVVFR